MYEEGYRYIDYFTIDDSVYFVVRKCSMCKKFITSGQVYTNGLDDIILKYWICSQHGEVEPDEYGWVD